MRQIRKIEIGDKSTVLSLEHKIFKDPWSETLIKEQLTNESSSNLYYLKDNMVCGYVLSHNYLDFMEIQRIGVLREFRGENIGTKLLEYIESLCCELGIKKISLEVRESNENAIKTYNNFGFKVDSVRKKYYKKCPEDAILMSKSLS